MSKLLTSRVYKLRGICFRKDCVENYLLFINEMKKKMQGIF